MTSTTTQRDRLAIMKELLQTTNDMVSKRHDSEFLLGGVEQREKLIEEFDAQPDILSDEDKAECKQIARRIMQKDNIINTALRGFYKEAKEGLTTNTNQQKLMGYTNLALSSMGSYMDYKK